MLLGARGMLGYDLAATAPEDMVLFAFSRAALDLTHRRALAAKIAEVKPDLIVNAAAYTAVDEAESEPRVAFNVNGEAVQELAVICADEGIRVVHFSTDYVFDGTSRLPYREDAPTRPVNVYGASKLAGEVALQESGAQYLIIRTQWLFGVHGRSFPRTMWERAVQRIPTRVVADQTGRATYTRDLAGGAWDLIRRNASGVFHLANEGQVTWYDIAEFVFRLCGCPVLLSRCTTSEYPTPAHRPLFTVLECTKFEETTGRTLPCWQDAVTRYLAAVGPHKP
ncbi:MAG: dTDP-4-dehydrorhamnose reductase [bacterium]